MSAPTRPLDSHDQDKFDHNQSSLRDELIECIKDWGCVLPSEIDDNSSLITSGLLDSLALFNLTLWIETKTGHRLDPTSLNVANEWDSITNILRFIRSADGIPDQREVQVSPPSMPSIPKADYRVVRYSPVYKDTVAEFQKGLWSPDRGLNLRYLEWKFEQNPYAQEARIYLAFYRDSLVGMRGFYPSRWEWGDPAQQVPILVADDLLVREDHRNQGLVTKIMKAAFDDLRGANSEFLFNLSGSKLTVLNSIAMGWRSIGTLRPMERRSCGPRFFSALKERLDRLPYLNQLLSDTSNGFSFSRLDRMAVAPHAKNGVEVEISSEPRADAMARLIRRLDYDGRLRHVRDEPYFNWRFQNPLHEYRFLYVGGKELDGYLVLKRRLDRPDPCPQVSIVDIEGISIHIQQALLKTAVAPGGFSELIIWTATVSEKILVTLRDLGFRLLDEELVAGLPCFLVRPINDDQLGKDWRLKDLRLLDPFNWDIRMLYSMVG
jgi:acyl carrier protein/GNAT superfamily N-acetyltransferase